MPVLNHPCFGQVPCGTFGRIHLPVAPKCNISCAFCDRKYDCASESRPGVSSKIISPEEALELTIKTVNNNPRITVAGIAGPGESLANEETFKTLKLIRSKLPDLILCLSTNGLLLEEKLPELIEAGVNTITVTVNASTLFTASKIYEYISYEGQKLPIEEGLRHFMYKQLKGIKLASKEGITVKVNTVLIPGINDNEIEDIAISAFNNGASIHNIMPLIPCGRLSNMSAPTHEDLLIAQKTSELHIKNYYGCKQCRADACGLI